LRVLVAKDANGNIIYVKAMGGMVAEVLQGISDTNVLTYIVDGDIDPDWASQFKMEEDESNNGSGLGVRHLRRGSDSADAAEDVRLRGSLRHQIDQKIQQKIQEEQHERDLQTQGLRTIEIAIATDSSFCSGVGGSANVAAKVQSIIADVATDYEQSNLMFTAKISHLEFFCSQTNDPYKACIDLNASGCDNTYGLLDCFQLYWQSNRSAVSRDVAQLFSGKSLECRTDGCVIGCAYVGTACDNNWGFGVNWVTYTTNTVAQSQLVSHEIGHNLGAVHDSSSTNFIMSPFDSTTVRIFSDQSVASFLSVTKNACVTAAETLATSAPTTASPTPLPTPLPTPAPPTPSPTRAPKINGGGRIKRSGG
jgi:hypothetical protein